MPNRGVDGKFVSNAPQPKQAKAPSSPYLEIGGTGLRRFGGYVHEDFDPNLNGKRAAAVYDEMRRNDPDVAALLNAIEYMIRAIDWVVVPGGETQADLDAAEFLRQCMDDMSYAWGDLISDICSMFPFGWAMFEIVYKQRLGLDPGGDQDVSLYDDGKIGWHKFGLRGQESLSRWEFKPGGGIKGMWQLLPGGAFPELFIPIEKCILFRVRREKNNPEGWSILRPAYRPWYIKKNLEEIEVQGAERDLVGVLKVKLPPNATDLDRSVARGMLEDFHAGDQVGVMEPTVATQKDEPDWSVELLKSPGAKVVDTDKVIQRHSIAIARSSLAQFLTLGSGKVGSYALSKDMKDLFQVAGNGHLDTIEDTLNRFAVRDLFELNKFPGMTALPQIRHTDLGEVELGVLVKAYADLKAAGVPLDDPETVNYMRVKMGFEELDEEYFEQLEKEKEEQAQLDREAGVLDLEGKKAQIEAVKVGATTAAKAKPEQGAKPSESTKKKAAKEDTPGWQAMSAKQWAEWLTSDGDEEDEDPAA